MRRTTHRVARASLWLLLLGLLSCCASSATAESTPADWVVAAQGVLQRLIPQHSSSFVFAVESARNSSSPLPNLYDDFFSVEASNGTVFVTGTSGVSLTSGAYWYLKNVAGCQVTWGVNNTGKQVALPEVLPDVSKTIVNATVPIRYAWNMCTFSYSAVWWNEARWQEEIDWMALHGVNFPLALTGQEYVWLKVFERYNVSLQQLEPWLTGPAFLAWQRAGNIQGFAGPLSYHWIYSQYTLQQFILRQMRALGMKPIQACFAGHVPSVARVIWPHANFTQSASWNFFPANETYVWYLDPTDPLFTELGSLFTQVVVELFGTDHYYSCDTFNEVDPKSTAPSYLKAASASVHQSIALQDPQGIWVMQAWLFHSSYWKNASLVEAYLSGVGNDSMLILDLNSEAGVLATQYKEYYGKPWVWNMLHNYGGVRGVYGNLTEIATSPLRHLYRNGSTMIGIGFTPEAIEQNPVMYEMLTSTFWGGKEIEVEPWLRAYVQQRYGGASEPAWHAWKLLLNAVYNQPGEPRSEIEWVPHWETPSYGWANGNATGMYHAFVAFLDAAADIPDALTNGPFLYDFVDVTRQASTMFFSDLHRQLSNEAFNMEAQLGNYTRSLTAIRNQLLSIIATLDQLLGTNPNYLFGTWISSALSLALPNETALYLYNAKNQVTLWGPSAQICDYAAKAWSGLYSDYYLRRWTYMLDLLVEGSKTNGWSWNSFTYDSNLLVVEEHWCANSTLYRTTPTTAGPSVLDIANTLSSLIHMPQAAMNTAFHVLQDSTSPGGNYIISPTRTQDPEQLALLCSMMQDCTGFTSDGFLRHGPINPYGLPGTTLYVKNTTTKKDVAEAPAVLRPRRHARSHDDARGPRGPRIPRSPRDDIIARIPRHFA